MIILLGGCPSGQRSLSLPEARLCGQAYEALGQLDMAIDNADANALGPRARTVDWPPAPRLGLIPRSVRI